MCGIIGYIGKESALPILEDGLSRLEYRGYDSSGIVCINSDGFHLATVKKEGKLSVLRKALAHFHVSTHVGLGHTRWATHGEPSDRNAHPHLDCSKKFAVVHNGIFENYDRLKRDLRKEGHRFSSDTDTETAVHLIEKYYSGDLVEAFRKAVGKLQGYFALVTITSYEPDKIVAFKRSNPLIIGLAEGGNFVASDVSAVLPYTRRVIYLEDDEYAVVTADRVDVYQLGTGDRIEKPVSQVRWSVAQAQKGGYPHFMLKEIYEQPKVCQEIVDKRIDRARSQIAFDTFTDSFIQQLKRVERLVFVSCGTAFHAALTGKYMMEEYVKMACEENVSSEFRYYGDPLLGEGDLVILVSQSGETADTIAALKEARHRGAATLAVCNVVGSTIAREANAVIYTHAGPEIGVASTKAYVAQLLNLALLTVYMGYLRGTIKKNQLSFFVDQFKQIPHQAQAVLKESRRIDAAAHALYKKKNFLYLARGFNVATALEGALKLKEISYIHAHGYAAGEMKHGPIALVDPQLPIVCIAPKSKTYEKMISNIEELRARDGIIVSVATAGDKEVAKRSDYVFYIPETIEFLSPVLAVIPLQLLAYRIAVLNSCDVDQPKNLAKSVTVE